MSNKKLCCRCNGSAHSAQQCRFKNTVCHNCHKQGHIKKACRSKSSTARKPAPRRKLVNFVDDDHQVPSDDNYIASLELNNLICKDIIWIQLKITGSAVSVIAEGEFRKKLGKMKLNTSDITLRTYSGEHLKPVGYVDVQVEYDDFTQTLLLYVVHKGGPALLGRDWLKKIQLDWKVIKETHSVHTEKSTNIGELLEKYKDVFCYDVRSVKGITAKLSPKENKPKYVKARAVPFSLRAKVEEELDRLEAEGTLTKVQHSDWATPIVPVLKKNGTVRIWGFHS